MLAGLGAFAGGLGDGIRKGQQLKYQSGLMELQKQREAREAESHQMKTDEFNNQKKMTTEWASLLGWKRQEAPVQPSPGGLSNDFPAVSDTRAPGLTKQPQAPEMPASEFVHKQVMTPGGPFDDPDTLTKMAQIAGKYGFADKMIPFLNQAHEARKTGITNSFKYLLNGDGRTSAELLRKGGINIEGDLTPVSSDNLVWSGTVNGQQRQFNVKDMIASGNPDTWLKIHNDQQKLEAEKPEREAKINALNANAEKDRATGQYYLGAKTNEAAARAGRYDRMGLGSDKPEKIDAAIKRRDSALDALSSVTGDDGKPFVDPQKRMTYSSLAVDAEQAVSDMLGGRDLTAREQHALTDMIRTAPLGNSQAMGQWAKQLQQRFGGKQTAKPQGGLDTPRPAPQASAGPLGTSREPAAANPSPGSLAQRPEDVAAPYKGTSYYDEMLSVHRALQSANLGPEQRRVLALRANEIANQYTKQYGRRS